MLACNWSYWVVLGRTWSYWVVLGRTGSFWIVLWRAWSYLVLFGFFQYHTFIEMKVEDYIPKNPSQTTCRSACRWFLTNWWQIVSRDVDFDPRKLPLCVLTSFFLFLFSRKIGQIFLIFCHLFRMLSYLSKRAFHMWTCW